MFQMSMSELDNNGNLTLINTADRLATYIVKMYEDLDMDAAAQKSMGSKETAITITNIACIMLQAKYDGKYPLDGLMNESARIAQEFLYPDRDS